MPLPESFHAARAALLASDGVFTVLDPNFAEGAVFCEFLNTKAKTRLRYLAVTDRATLALPALPNQLLSPGLHFFDLPQFNAELHLWVGPAKAGLQEFQGQVNAFVSADAERPPAWRFKQPATPANAIGRVAVVGAGIAGSSVARALCKKGVRVHLFDSASEPATGASGNWVGAFHPHITRGDSPLSRLSRLGLEHTEQALAELTKQGLLQKGKDWDTPGHLQTVPSDEAARMRETLLQLNFPEVLVRWVEPNVMLPSPLGGLFFPQGGWVKPARWVQANLQACGSLLSTHYNSPVGDLETLRQQYDAVVVCCAEQSIVLAPIEGARVGAVKGQISKVRAVAAPKVVLSGESYAIAPPNKNWMVLGATYERPVLDLIPTRQADDDNIARFKTAFPQWPVGELLDHRCAVRSVWHDRLPAIGPVPGMPGVYMSTGFASRGLLWAALGGWMVADHCMGQSLSIRLLEKIKPRGARA